MAKKVIKLSDYVTAEQGAHILSERGWPVSARNMYQLAHRKKNPIRTQQVGNRFLYHRGDIESITLRQRSNHDASSQE